MRFYASRDTIGGIGSSADIAKLKDQRSEVMKAFESQPGWRVTVEAANGSPLMLAGFDPLNVSRMSAEMVLHKRSLKLQTGSGSLEIMNHGSLTTGTVPIRSLVV